MKYTHLIWIHIDILCVAANELPKHLELTQKEIEDFTLSEFFGIYCQIDMMHKYLDYIEILFIPDMCKLLNREDLTLDEAFILPVIVKD